MGYPVVVAVATDVDEHWRTDPTMVEALEMSGAQVIMLGSWFGRDPDRIRDAAARLRQRVADKRFVVHAHLAPAVSVGRLAGASNVVATCHGWNPNRPAEYDEQDAAAYQHCSVVTSPSRFWADRLMREWSVPRVDVVPYGFDLSGEPCDQPTGASGAAPRVVSVCELTHRKGVDLLIDAMAVLWRDLPTATLNIFGIGDAEHDLRRRAARVDPGGQRICFDGWVVNPRRLLRSFSLFCLASRSDNYPLAIMDAMLSGLPIVSTRVGGIPEAIEDSGCGSVVPPDNSALLAGAIGHLLEDSKAAAVAGRRGWEYARARFDVNAVAHTFARLYREHPKS